MSEFFTLKLQPIGKAIRAPADIPLRDLLFDAGVEFPCGGNGRCRGCRIRVLEGTASFNAEQQAHLSSDELAMGWRLACQCRLEGDLAIEMRQWDAAILSDESHFAFTPQDGLGIAVDIGTTTLVAQLLDLRTGHVLGVKSALNPQGRYGADVMSRVQAAVADGCHTELANLIRSEVGKMSRQLLAAADAEPVNLRRIVLVGNTVMHHLFCGIDLESLSHYPFEPVDDGIQTLEAAELGWHDLGTPVVEFLPCLGSFVGSDVLAGVIATGIHTSADLSVLIDLGTNGEIVVGNRERLLCASTAAGPAFEGARIRCGMRATTGAIWKVSAKDGALACETLGNAEPRGICGSGLVDAAAAALDIGALLPTGRLSGGAKELMLAGCIGLTGQDIRQIQLAKGAIAAGVRLLLDEWGATLDKVACIYLAGAFGNYVDRDSARRIGLLSVPSERIEAAGNTALLGAKLALFDCGQGAKTYTAIREMTRHVSLNEDARFIDVYVEEMGFPASIASETPAPFSL